MLDSIFIGMSGLMGYSRGLRVIANNTANINTPGFKGAALQFGDLFYANGPASGSFGNAGPNQLGQGLTTYSTSLDFSQGELRQSGNDLDLAVDGQGLFTLKDKDGNIRYTRDGAFKFDDDGFLVSRTSGAKVMGYDDKGGMVEITLSGLRTNPPKATSTLKFNGSLGYSTDAVPNRTKTLTDVMVRDAAGSQHSLTVEFKQLPRENANDTRIRWQVTLKDAGKDVGTGTLVFVNTILDPSSSKITINYKPDGADTVPLTLDFGVDTTVVPYGGSGADPSTIKVGTIDGYANGDLVQATFDGDGVMNLKYSNGQTTKGAALAVARFTSVDNVRSAGDNMFEPVDQSTWETGRAGSGAFGAIRSGVVEISNVDLSSEFSDLVIMQRGYQASSQVVSTANEMLQELFSLKGR
jgi:flagellar hook protein FlgE